MGSTYRPLTKDEALHLNRWQLFDRARQEQDRWARRRRRVADDGQAELNFRALCYDLLGVDDTAADFDTALADTRRRATVAYLNSRVDGSPPRPPRRVQLRRAAGFRLPPGVKVVSRPGRYGNPFNAGPRAHDVWLFDMHLARRRARPYYNDLWPYPSDQEIRADLAGWDLACWCPLTDEPGAHCHADVLLRLANHSYWPNVWPDAWPPGWTGQRPAPDSR